MATGRHFSSEHEAPNQNRPMGEAVGVRPVRAAASQEAKAGRKAGMGTNKAAGPANGGPRRPRWRKPAKPLVVAALVAALALAGVGGALAWLVSTDSLINTFELGKIGTEVVETFPEENGTVKKDVKVKNASNIDAWVRVQVSIYWQDASDNQMWQKPVKDVDYSISPGNSTKWLEGTDGMWYYTSPVAAKKETDILIKSLEVKQSYPDGRCLVCDIAAQTIQADPSSAVEKAWGVKVDESNSDSPTLTKENGKVAVTPTQSATTESEVA